MADLRPETLVRLDTGQPIWERLYTVAPLVVIGSKEGERYDLAPKHMAFPLGWGNYFGFVCTPRHGTYQNVKKHKVFTVSYPRPDSTVLASLAALPRCEDGLKKPIIDQLPTFRAETQDGIFLGGGYLFMECELDRIIDGFGENSLITGKIKAAFIDPSALRVSEGDDAKMIFDHPLLAYLYPGRFAEIRETQAFPFPSDFKK